MSDTNFGFDQSRKVSERRHGGPEALELCHDVWNLSAAGVLGVLSGHLNSAGADLSSSSLPRSRGYEVPAVGCVRNSAPIEECFAVERRDQSVVLGCEELKSSFDAELEIRNF